MTGVLSYHMGRTGSRDRSWSSFRLDFTRLLSNEFIVRGSTAFVRLCKSGSSAGRLCSP